MEVIEMKPSEFLMEFSEWKETEVDDYRGIPIYILSVQVGSNTYRTICSATGKTKKELMRENFEVFS